MNEQTIKDALAKVTYPGFKKDIVTFGFVKDITIESQKAYITVD
ncbi:MAG: iron-sulfur cluster assembly protein, partial [Campylobacterota bacterium]